MQLNSVVSSLCQGGWVGGGGLGGVNQPQKGYHVAASSQTQLLLNLLSLVTLCPSTCLCPFFRSAVPQNKNYRGETKKKCFCSGLLGTQSH